MCSTNRKSTRIVLLHNYYVAYSPICKHSCLTPRRTTLCSSHLPARLGNSPRVLGGYDTSQAPKIQADRRVQLSRESCNVLKVLTQCAFLAPPLENGPWAHIYRAPEVEGWSDASSKLDSEATTCTVAGIVREASDYALDMDYVVARCVYDLPSGILGLGQSAEARVFVFCRVGSAYAYEKDVLQLSPSLRTRKQLASVNEMSDALRRALIRQMCPIVDTMSTPNSPQDSSTASNVATSGSRSRESARTNIPPFWLFLVDLAETTDAVWSQLNSFLTIWDRYKHITLPATAIPVMTLIGWILIGYRSSERVVTETGDAAREPKQLNWGSNQLSWILSARIADVDDCLKLHPASLVAHAWAKARRPFMKNLASNIDRFSPEVYGAHTERVVNTMLELAKYVSFACFLCNG